MKHNGKPDKLFEKCILGSVYLIGFAWYVFLGYTFFNLILEMFK